MRPIFSAEEMEEMRRADEEIERDFRITPRERERQNATDRRAKIDSSYGIAAKKREYREANRDAIAAYQREYYEANREAIKAKAREYYEANRDAIAAYQREYYEANRDAIAAYQREYYEANRESAGWERDAVKRIREELGMTQRQLASLLDVTPSTISRYESGELAVDKGRFEAAGLKLE